MWRGESREEDLPFFCNDNNSDPLLCLSSPPSVIIPSPPLPGPSSSTPPTSLSTSWGTTVSWPSALMSLMRSRRWCFQA